MIPYSAVAASFFLRRHKKYKTRGKLGMFYDAQISRKQEKIHHIQGQRPSIKCVCEGREFKLIVARMHMGYPFPIGNEDVFLLSIVQISFYLLNFKFPLIMTEIVSF